MYFFSVASATGTTRVQLLSSSSNFPPQLFKCPKYLSTRTELVFSLLLTNPRGSTGRKSLSQVFIADRLADIQKPHTQTDLVTFICIVVFVFKLKADHSQSRMSRLMQTVLQDGVLYFFVMAAFHAAMVLFTAMRRVIGSPLLIESVILTLRYPSLPFCRRLSSWCTCFAIPVEFVANLKPPD